MTDTTTARRALLDLLLDRIERGALLDNEAPLLRPLVLAEQANADRPALDNGPSLPALRDEIAAALENADYRHDMRRGDLADAVMPVIRSVALQLEHMTTDRDGWWARALELGETIGRRLEAAEAAVARVRALAEGEYYGITGRAFLAALDGLTPAPDDTPTVTDEEPEQPSETPILDGMLAGYRAQHPADDAPTAPCRVMPTRTCPEAYRGPCGDRLCARFESDDPAPWTPEQPTEDATSEPQS